MLIFNIRRLVIVNAIISLFTVLSCLAASLSYRLYLHIRGGKTKAADRYVPIPKEVADMLPDKPNPFLPICQTKEGNKISARRQRGAWQHMEYLMNIELGCKTYRNKLIPPFPLADDLCSYCLRHTFCTNLQRRGVDIRTAQKLIQSLFSDETKEESPWTVINVNSLTDNEVIQIVGEEYNQLPVRVKELIHTPSSLYVWLKLDPEKRMNQIESSQDMVFSWWRQIQDNYAAIGHNQSSLSDCISEIVTSISNSGSFAIPRSMLLRYTREMDYLASGGRPVFLVIIRLSFIVWVI